MCATSLTTSPQHHLVAKFPFRFCMVLPLISASYSYTPFISLSSCSPSNMCVTSLTTSPQHHLVAKFPFRFCMVLLLISASYSYTPFISLSSMLHMISIFLLIVKKWLVSGLVLLSIVVTLSPTWSLMLKPSKSSIEVLSGPGLLKTPIKRLWCWRGGRSSATLQTHQKSNFSAR